MNRMYKQVLHAKKKCNHKKKKTMKQGKNVNERDIILERR